MIRITQSGFNRTKYLQPKRNLTVEALSSEVRRFVEDNAKICQPKDIYVCDGTIEENQNMIGHLVKEGRLKKLPKYDNW